MRALSPVSVVTPLVHAPYVHLFRAGCRFGGTNTPTQKAGAALGGLLMLLGAGLLRYFPGDQSAMLVVADT